MERYDLIIKGGRLIDPAGGIDAPRNIGVRGGRVAVVSETPIAEPASETVDAGGAYVAPGFIDLHAHVSDGMLPGTNADTIGLPNGVTTVVDAGSTGWANLNLFRDGIVPGYVSRVYAFVHVSATGLAISRFQPELGNIAFAKDVEHTAEAVKRNPALVIGVKVRIARAATGEDPENAREALRLARKAADMAGSPLMVHIAGTTIPTGEIFDSLRSGDVATHIFHGNPDNIYDGTNLKPEVRRALDRGVVADVAHATIHFHAEIARRAIESGLIPRTISTDLHSVRPGSRCYTLHTVMSKLLALGMPLVDVVAAVTSNAAQAMGRAGEVGSVAVGRDADITVFDFEEGRFSWVDASKLETKADRRIRIREVFRSGRRMNAGVAQAEAIEHDPAGQYVPQEAVPA
jgi:dihydroorotase